MKRKALIDLITRMREVVDDDHFNMRMWLFRVGNDGITGIYYTNEDDVPHCKTGGCLAGEVFLSLTPEKRQEYYHLAAGGPWSVPYHAAIIELGLYPNEARMLFEPLDGDEMTNWTREQAIQVLEHIRDTGYIDWGRVVDSRATQHPPLHVELTD